MDLRMQQNAGINTEVSANLASAEKARFQKEIIIKIDKFIAQCASPGMQDLVDVTGLLDEEGHVNGHDRIYFMKNLERCFYYGTTSEMQVFD
jgi:hypothetical protein